MALSKAKQQVLNQFSAVLESLDDKNPLDQNILRAAHGLFKALVDASAGQGEEAEAEIEADDGIEIDGDESEVEGAEDDVSFDDDEATSDEELEIDGDEASDEGEVEADGEDEVSFDDDESAEDDVTFEEEAPAKPSRKPAAAAAPVEEEATDYDSMKAQDLFNHLVERGVSKDYARKIFTASKKDGLVKLAKNIDKLKALWIKNAIFKKPVAVIEKYVTTKMGVDQPSYGRGRSSDEKKKGILAEALAVAMKKPA